MSISRSLEVASIWFSSDTILEVHFILKSGKNYEKEQNKQACWQVLLFNPVIINTNCFTISVLVYLSNSSFPLF